VPIRTLVVTTVINIYWQVGTGYSATVQITLELPISWKSCREKLVVAKAAVIMKE